MASDYDLKGLPEQPDFKQLSDDLLGMLITMRFWYEIHTNDHPDDEIRVMMLRISEELIQRARKELQ